MYMDHIQRIQIVNVNVNSASFTRPITRSVLNNMTYYEFLQLVCSFKQDAEVDIFHRRFCHFNK